MNRSIRFAASAIAIALLLTASGANADTILVPADQPTIQAGIDAAAAGDLVLVAAGSYVEDVHMAFGDITLRADGEVRLSAQTWTVLYCSPDWDAEPPSTVEGFIFENSPFGIVVDSDYALTVRDCIFQNQAGGGPGSAIQRVGHAPLIVEDCIFRNCQSDWSGGAVSVLLGPATFRRCQFLDNHADNNGGAAHCDSGSDPFLFEDCLFAGNTALYGGAMEGEYGGDFTVRNCTFVGNESVEAGVLTASTNTSIAVENCIIAMNTGVSLHCDGTSGLLITCSDVWGNSGGDWQTCAGGQNGVNGNFSENPMFCDAQSGDYTLYNLSPCLPENNGCNTLIGAYGHGCDETGTGLPEHAIQDAGWGALKRLY